MAGCYAYIIAALLMTHQRAMDAKSSCNAKTAVIKRNLQEEERSPRFFGDSPDTVCTLTPREKQDLCDEVARHLIGKKLHTLLGKGDLAEPQIAKKYIPFLPRDVRIKGMKMSKRMFWCAPRKYAKKVSRIHEMISPSNPKSQIGQIEGFFCAGSATKGDKVYVFRPKDAGDEEVALVAELSNWLPGESSTSSSSECSDDDYDVAKNFKGRTIYDV